ncbi:Ca2+-binding protein, RTX toxin-related [Loktanella sp. DSM 29012]|uniref:Ig-like domain-containing protein n=1 Tax=Loktanella sp. DSM 29012 TaxID=1881056 RepID=UPI0008CD725D|nr:Ig-like domain-containing protein [Loktanella sp. DSM 29012]SEQ24320.1 Ca2+-binding protein, RTX toxin-related [Loktanella sp. DSM 29012]
MTAISNVNLIYLGNYADVDVSEFTTSLLLFKTVNYDAEHAANLEGITRTSSQLSLVQATLRDAEHDGVISDNENSHDTVAYTINGTSYHNKTDSTLTGTLRVTLSDGSVRDIDALLVQQDNGDLFVSDLLNGGTLDNLSIAQIEITDIKTTDSKGWFSNQSVDNTTFAPVVVTPPAPDGDGTVLGTDGDDVINGAYNGDPEGDRIDAGDAIAAGAGPDDDIVVAGLGDDTVLAGLGEDTVFGDTAGGGETAADGDDLLFGGAGDDTVFGQGGDDTIFGDAGGDVIAVGARESFEWNKAPGIATNGHLQHFTQDTGTVNVSFTFSENYPHEIDTTLAGNVQNINGIDADGEAIDGTSSLSSELPASHKNAQYNLAFDTPVTNVSFNINDVDGDGVVRVQAFDANGQQISVNLDGGSHVTLKNTDSVAGADTIDSNGGYLEDISDAYSATVTIPGPVSRIEVFHSQDGHNNSGVNLTDVYFDGASTIVDEGVAGDDVLFGGSGNDVIEGNGGDDSIFGGSGNDTIDGDTSGQAGGTPGPVVRESFNWDLVTDAEVDSTVTQNTGAIDVTYTRTIDTGAHFSELSHDALNTQGILSGGEVVDNDTSLASETSGFGNTGQFQWAFSAPVENVSFNVNDIDGDGVVKIEAFDANGVAIPVTLTGGSHLTLKDTDSVAGADTADSNGGYQADTSPNYNLNVLVQGPVSKIVLTHTQDGHDNSGINVTDIYFNAAPDLVGGDNADAGNDFIDGGEGDDIIAGNGGDDSILGGSGDDVIRGDNGVVTDPVDPTPPQTDDTVQIAPVAGAKFTLAVWDLSTVDQTTAAGKHPTFPDGTSGNSNVVGNTFTIPVGTQPVSVGVNDNDLLFGDGDTSQVLAQSVTIDGEFGKAGTRFTPEYAYSVRDSAGNVIDVYAVELNGNETVGFVTDKPLTQDETYEVIGRISTHPHIPFNEIATSYNVPAGTGTPIGGGNGGTPIVAVDGDDVIDGGVGNDIIEGNGGQDFIDGGEGNDVITAGVGDEVDPSTAPASGMRPADDYQNAYAGGAGGDLIVGGVGDDIITGDDDSRVSEKTGQGFDAGADGSDTIFGGEGNDEIHVGTWADGEQNLANESLGNAADTAFGGAGDDILVGDNGDDVLVGDEGDDRIIAGGGQDFVSGSAGNDTITAGAGDPDGTGGQAASGARPADEYDNAFAGGSGDDTITGGAGDDIITGDDDSRVSDKTGEAFDPNADGSDVIYGGAGDDEIHVGSWADGEQDLANESLGFADDTAYGGDGNDILVGDLGNDTLYGDAGDDLIIGTGGNDKIFGGDDADTIRATAGDVVDGGTGTTTGTDFDVLEIPAGQPFINAGPGGVGLPVLDADGDSFSGRIIFTDGNGNPTGGVIDYTEIEEIRGGEPENGAPVAVEDLLAAGEDDASGIIGNVLGNDTDPDNDTLTVSAVNGVPGDVGQPVDLPDGGTVTIAPDGTVTFDPAGDFEELGEGETATTTFTYTVTDPDGAEDTATVTITVTGTNDAPVAVMDEFPVSEDQDPTTVIGNVLDNDSDPEGDPLTVGSVNGDPANVGQPVAGDNGGLVTINPDGTVTFDPNGEFDDLAEGEEATTTVTYTPQDDSGLPGDPVTVTLTVTGTNDGPVAIADNLGAGEDDANAVIGNVLGNDTDPENDPLTVSAVNGDSNSVGVPVAADNGGTVTIAPNGTIAFDPNDDFEQLGEGETATTTVTYTVTDPDGVEDTATVTITVTGTNDAPIAVADTGVSSADMVQPLDNVLGNDTDPDLNDVLTVGAVDGDPAKVGQPVAGDNGGLVTINPDGSASFDPNGEFDNLAEGEEVTTTVTYTVIDGNGGEDSTTVTITVTGTNGAPVATNDPLTAGEDDPSGIIGNVLDNDVDPNGDPLTVAAVNGVPGDVGQPVDLPDGGTVTIAPDGTVTFDPAGDFDDLGEGEERTTTVTYTVTDPAGAEDTATVTITVTGTNDAPVAVMDEFPVSEDQDPTTVIGNVLDNDSDPEGDPLTVGSVNGDPANVGQPVAGDNGGLVTINPDGTVTFDPNGEFDDLAEGEEATTTVTYTPQDDSGLPGDPVTVTLTVTGTNDGPVASDDIFVVAADETAGDVDGNVITGDNGAGVDTDPEGDTLTVVGVNAALGGVGTPVAGDNGGLFTIAADGTVDFDPNGDFDNVGLNDVVETSVTYTISDGNGGTDTATVTFRVGGDNDGTIQGTAGDDIINPDIPYVDADGDIVDGNDAKLPGDTGNDDLILGFEGDDSIDAGDGNDEVFGGADDDTIDGGVGDDTLSGDAGNDSIFGNDGDDTILGGEGDDSIRGGDGVDTIEGGAGNDTINGGDDNDTIDGGAGNDVLDGNLGDDVVVGGDGNDTIQGGAGNDTLAGDAGDDSITGGVGSDSVTGGDGNDVINTGNHANPATDYDYPGATVPGLPIGDNDPFPNDDRDVVDGGAGDDIITTGDDDDIVFGGTGNDTIDAGIDDDFVSGGAGNDTIIGGQGVDTLQGDDGDDVIFGGLETDTFDLPDAIDPAPDDNRDTIFGGAGNDTIYGRDDADSISGGTGDDLIFGGIDDDTIAGNQGNDTLYGDQGNDTLTGSLDDDLVYGGTGDDFIQGGSGFDTLYGDEGNDRIQGGNDDDQIFGGVGDDSIQGGGGNDTIDGGEGNDLIGAFDGDDSILGGEGDDVIRSQGGDDSIFGGDGNDQIYAGAGNDTVAGNMGDDTIFGGEGDDSLTGSFGNDSVFGGAGNDFIQGGADTDLLDGGDGDDRIQGDNGDDLIFGGAGNDSIQGGGGNDVVDGGTGDDIIGGFIGDDSILGGDGNDVIRSGGGSDTVDGGAGNDQIFTDEGNSNLPDKDYPGDGLAADPDPFDNRDTVFGGDGDDTIRTGDDADTIFGGDGSDNIDAGVDDDVISSGDGADVVRGGFGNDTFSDVSSGDVIFGGEDPDDGDIDRFNFDQATLDKIDRIETNGGAGDAEELRESGTIFFKDGTTATFEEIEAPCFTPGTLIATPKGERLVEDLRVGDKIITRDNGIQEIAWYGQKEFTGKELAAKPHMKPILVKAGSLGHGLPERDMMLSPNHRLLVSSEKTQLYFEEREVLAAAKHMVGAQGIHTVDVMRTTYIHFMFEQHEVVLSNGAWTESFHPGDYSLNGLGNSQRNEIFELFPELKTEAGLQGYQSARKALKKHEAKLLMK